MSNAIAIRPLTFEAAKALVELANNGIQAFYESVVELHAREGWKILGYTNWSDCVKNEFSISKSQSYRIIDASKLTRKLGIEVTPGQVDRIKSSDKPKPPDAEPARARSAPKAPAATTPVAPDNNGSPQQEASSVAVAQREAPSVAYEPDPQETEETDWNDLEGWNAAVESYCAAVKDAYEQHFADAQWRTLEAERIEGNTLRVTLKEYIATVRVTKKSAVCKRCDGTGGVGGKCQPCRGLGWLSAKEAKGNVPF